MFKSPFYLATRRYYLYNFKIISTLIEHYFNCPYCLESISVLIDITIREQTYIEDCQVCCNPIEIRAVVSDGEIVEFEAQNIGQ